MVFNVAVLGSCVSRDIFYSQINPGYKDYFNLVLANQRQSIISLMQDPVTFNREDLKISPENRVNSSRTLFLKDDLDKTFLNRLNSNIDLMVLDNYFEAYFGVLYIGGGRIITNNFWDLPETDFYKSLEVRNPLTITENTDEFLDLWKESVESFFSYLERHCPDTRIVLNSARSGCKILKKDGSVEFRKDFQQQSIKINRYLELLDSHMVRNYDVRQLKFDDATLLDESHIWGIGYVHYEREFYEKRLMELVGIAEGESIISRLKKAFRL